MAKDSTDIRIGGFDPTEIERMLRDANSKDPASPEFKEDHGRSI